MSETSVFNYLKSLASDLSDKPDGEKSAGAHAPITAKDGGDVDEKQLPFLYRQYKKLEKMDKKEKEEVYKKSVLRYILKQNQTTLPETLPSTANLILPFQFNLSQEKAITRSLSEQISLIQGPPGTGKTQTILNIIANVVVQGKTIAVVSNNNEAVKNVYAKLKQHELDFLCTALGSDEKTEAFFADEYQGKEHPFWQTLVTTNKAGEKEPPPVKLSTNLHNIKNLLAKEIIVARTKLEIENLKAERENFAQSQKYAAQQNSFLHVPLPKILGLMRANKVMNILSRYQYYLISHPQDSLFANIATLIFKIKMLLLYGITNFQFFNERDNCIATLQSIYYEKKIHELKQQATAIEKNLRDANLTNMLQAYMQNSWQFFMQQMRTKYRKQKEIFTFNYVYYLGNFEEFIKQHPVMLCTNHSLIRRIQAGYLFDYLVMDEASQSDIVSATLALSCAKQAIIIGDKKQLQHVVSGEHEEISEGIFKSNQPLPEYYQYHQNSILMFLEKKYPHIKTTLLNEHYRCHPSIIEFCNRKFYAGALVALTKNNAEKMPIEVIRTSEGNHAKYNNGRFEINLREVEEIDIYLQNNVSLGAKSIAIITPFKKQRDQLQKKIEKDNIKIGTIHAFQGQEKDVVVLSTATNKIKNEFVDDPNMINVAISRAKEKFILVTNGNDFSDNLITDFIGYVEYIDGTVTPGKVNSIFDLLYKANHEKLLQFREKYPSVSDFDSENIMHHAIEALLSAQFDNLKSVLHYPLNMLITNKTELTPRELEFVNHQYTHIDFVLFNKFNKKAVLAIEVDGYGPHANNPKQLARDKLKDTILGNNDIPIIRFATNASNEKKKLESKLVEILEELQLGN